MSSSSSNDAGKKPDPKTAKGITSIFAYQPSAEVSRFAQRYRTELSAGSSSLAVTILAYPLDFTKSRMQSYGTPFTATVKDAYKAEGLRTFWRGVIPPLISITIVRTFSFSIYQKAKYSIDGMMTDMTGKSPLLLANAPHGWPNLYTLACFAGAGAISGLAVTVVSCPFELTKLNEQLAGKVTRDAVDARAAAIKDGNKHIPSLAHKKSGSLYTAQRLMKQRGLAGLYSGYQLHLLRDTIGTAIYFATYESAKQALANARGKDPTNGLAVVVAGGVCGIASWVCIYPIDVAKTIYQKALLASPDGRAVRPAIKFFQFGGYRGLGVSVFRSCLVNMLFFSNFESMKKRINALEAA